MKHYSSVKAFYGSLLALLLCIFSQTHAQVQTAKYISMTGNTNAFYEYLPQGYESGNQTYPLIVFIHGMGELGDGSPGQLQKLLYTGLAASINVGELPVSLTVNGQTHKFIVISPQFIGWPSPADVDAVINYAISHYRVNTSRIYLTGLSMGGGAVWDYVGSSAANANRIAAIVPICGASWPDRGRARTIAGGNVAVWALHNRYDPTVPVWYTESYLSQINEAPAPNPIAKANIMESGSHDAWTFTYNSTNKDETGKTIYQWMLQFQKGVAPPPSNNQVPTANAGANQNISLPATSVQLSGSGSDPDGTIASYAWRMISGPGNPSFSSTSIPNPVVSGLTSGTYVFRLTVTDNGYATAYSDVTINVRAAIPGKIEAEGYSAMSGVQTEGTVDAGGGLNVGWLDTGDWMAYNDINVATAGNYTVNFRLASPNTGGKLELRNSAGSVLATVTVPNTGNYQIWQTVSANITLPAGAQSLRVYCAAANGGWNINWMDFALSTGGTPPPPPPTGTATRIEAEAYTAMQGVQKENTSDAGGGQNIGWQDTGDWMDYAVSTASAGTYNVSFRVASMFTGATFQVRNASGAVLATVTVPNTGSFQGWTTVSAPVSLQQGAQTIRIHTSSASGGWNFNWWEIPSAPSTTTTPPPPPPPGPTTSQKIEGEAYTSMQGVQKESCSDGGGGENIGWQDNGDWMDYSVNISSAGTYTVNFRVASMFTGAQFQLRNSSGTVLSTVTVPNTGSFQSWATVPAQVSLPQGSQTLRIVTTNAAGGWNLNWWEIAGAGTTTPPPPPPTTSTRIEAENYTSMSGVQKENTSDAGGGQNIGWQDTGDWMDYAVSASTAGTYNVSFRVASMFTGATFQVRSSAGTVLATVTVPNTGSFQGWTTVTAPVALAGGSQTIRVYTSNAAGGWNLNWLEIPAAPGTATQTTRVAGEGSATAGELSTNSSSSTTTTELEVYPNPIPSGTDRFTLTVDNALTGTLQVDVVSLSGTVVKSFSLQKGDEGVSQFYLSLAEAQKGAYLIKTTMQNWTKSVQVIKE
jgi:hypothetical protein